MELGAALGVIEEQRKMIAALRVELEMERHRSAQMMTELKRLRVRVSELEMRVKQDSDTSHRPPSSDPPWKKRSEPTRERSGGNKGGQKGHRGNKRERLEPDQVIEHIPERCRECDALLDGLAERAPRVWQVTELEPMSAQVLEHRAHAKRCGRCGKRTYAVLPAEVSKSQFGPRMRSMIALLTGGYRMSHRQVQTLLEQVWSARISLGAVSRCQRTVSQALQVPYRQAHDYVERQNVLFADETSWKGPSANWLWTASTAEVSVFQLQERRNTECAKALLGVFRGLLTTDRFGSYNHHPMRKRQVCWAHLLREVKALGLLAEAAAFSKRMKKQIDAMFRKWHLIRDGTIEPSRARIVMKPTQRRIESLLERGARCRSEPVRSWCSNLLKMRHALFPFVRIPGAEPTNNRAERALRHAVIWRKTSFGTQSLGGARFVERICTALASLRAQKRDPLAFLERALCAHETGFSAPSVLPS